jgi:hypothetical protein
MQGINGDTTAAPSKITATNFEPKRTITNMMSQKTGKLRSGRGN